MTYTKSPLKEGRTFLQGAFILYGWFRKLALTDSRTTIMFLFKTLFLLQLIQVSAAVAQITHGAIGVQFVQQVQVHV